ncbi:MAG TPA: hypothetical protein VGB87_23110, partial [Vicinamibacteria bacterium]
LLPPSGTPQKNLLLKRVLKMTDRELRSHYLGRLYAGELSEFPYIASSGEAARLFVAKAANALAVVRAGGAEPSVRTLAIDGRRPGDAGYLLARAE